MKSENTLEKGTFARTHLPDEYVQAMEQEALKNGSMPVQAIRDHTQREFCTACGKKCFNYEGGKLQEKNNRLYFKDITTQQCQVKKS